MKFDHYNIVDWNYDGLFADVSLKLTKVSKEELNNLYNSVGEDVELKEKNVLRNSFATSFSPYEPSVSSVKISEPLPDYAYDDFNLIKQLLFDTEEEKMKERLNNLKIRNIYYDDTPGKEVVVVVFEDGTKIFKHLSQGDTFDLRTAVAFAIAEKLFGSKTQFKKFVERKAVKNVKKKKKETTETVVEENKDEEVNE